MSFHRLACSSSSAQNKADRRSEKQEDPAVQSDDSSETLELPSVVPRGFFMGTEVTSQVTEERAKKELEGAQETQAEENKEVVSEEPPYKKVKEGVQRPNIESTGKYAPMHIEIRGVHFTFWLKVSHFRTLWGP